MRPAIQFTGDFDAQPKTSLAPGNWYMGVRCETCGRGIALLDDPTGAGALNISGDARIRLSCPACGTTRIYEAGSLQLFQTPVGGLSAPPEAVRGG